MKYTELGKLYRKEREMAGLTIKQLSQRIGCSTETLSRLESGETYQQLFELLDALNKELHIESIRIGDNSYHYDISPASKELIRQIKIRDIMNKDLSENES